MLKYLIIATLAYVPSPTVPDVHTPPTQSCGTATEYGYGTKWHGNRTATHELFEPRKEATCAHRTLPFGTVLLVTSGEGGAWCRVNDRGPYIVRTQDGRRRHRMEPKPGEHWDGILDMSIKAAKLAGVQGMERVCIAYWSTPTRPEEWRKF